MQHSSCLLSLPLAKYSRALDVPRDVTDKFNWSHIERDLTLTIDTYRRDNAGHGSTLQMIRVFHGDQMLVSSF